MMHGIRNVRSFALIALALTMTAGNLACITVIGGRHSRCTREAVKIDGEWYTIDPRTREARRIHIIESEDVPRSDRHD